MPEGPRVRIDGETNGEYILRIARALHEEETEWRDPFLTPEARVRVGMEHFGLIATATKDEPKATE